MGKNNNPLEPKLPFHELDVLEQNYIDKLKTDSKYSLMVDPEDKYHMTLEQKEFVRNYVQFKNIPIAAQLTGIEQGLATEFWQMYSVQQEIRRINLAMYHRQFATKLINIDEIGGYLTSLLIDENVAIADRLEGKDKLNVVKLLIEVNKLKQTTMSEPEVIDAVTIEEQLKDLSVDSIQHLIDISGDPKNKEEKEKIIKDIKWENQNLTPEELTYLKTLSNEELLKMLDEMKRANKKITEK